MQTTENNQIAAIAENGADREHSATNVSASERNETWETNHNLITEAMSAFMKRYERMPGKNELAEQTGLSRQTIHKHLHDHTTCPEVQEQKEQFGIMTSNVLASLYKYAVCGDAKAARLYLETMEKMNNYENK